MGGRRVQLLIARALACAPAAVLALALDAGRASAQQPPPPGPRAFTSRGFSHRAHLKDGADAECLRCHGREQESIGSGVDRTVTSLSNCGECHAREKSIEVATRKVPGRSPFSRFSHAAHRASACATCHVYDREKDVFSIPAGIAGCASCHGTHDTGKSHFAGGGGAGGPGSCARCHLEKAIDPLAPAERGAFSHRAHLPRDRPALGADCARCHAEAAASKDLRDGKLLGARPERCAECHVAAPGAPPADARPSVEIAAMPVRRFFTEFDHAAHAKTYDCARCHELGPDDRFRFAGALPRYEGCVACHYHAGVRVKEHGRAIQCGRCHDASGAALRTAEFAKRDLGPVSSGAVAHPFIGPADIGREVQACGACHARARDGVPSRIAGKPFGHAAHLGPDVAAAAARGRFPTRERCLACHGALERAESPADSSVFDVAKDCAGCHIAAAGAPAVRVEPGPERRVVLPRFSHARHLAARNPRIAGCESCHDYDGPADRMRTPPDVLACKRCHDHKANADVTGQDLDKCIRCHTGESLFRQTVAVEVPNVHLAAVNMPPQHHERGGRCAECHAPPGGFAMERTTVAEVKHRNDPHVGLRLDSCKECHVRPKGF